MRRLLERHDDGLQKANNGFADHQNGMKKFWSYEETRRRKAYARKQALLRVKVVGSNPTSPTTNFVQKDLNKIK